METIKLEEFKISSLRATYVGPKSNNQQNIYSLIEWKSYKTKSLACLILHQESVAHELRLRKYKTNTSFKLVVDASFTN